MQQVQKEDGKHQRGGHGRANALNLFFGHARLCTVDDLPQLAVSDKAGDEGDHKGDAALEEQKLKLRQGQTDIDPGTLNKQILEPEATEELLARTIKGVVDDHVFWRFLRSFVHFFVHSVRSLVRPFFRSVPSIPFRFVTN